MNVARTRQLALWGSLLCAALTHAQTTPNTQVLRGQVHTADGVLPDGGVVLRDGQIVALGAFDTLNLPDDAEVIALDGAQITPGLVEAMGDAGWPESVAGEQGAEVVSDLRVVDGLDLSSRDFQRLAREGVTTVFVGGEPSAVLAARGAVLKTGPRARVVRADGAIRGTLGPEAWILGARNHSPYGEVDFASRRPLTRMGAVWVWREAFDRAAHDADDPASAALRRVVAGELPLRAFASTRTDVETALRLSAEFGVPRLIIDGGGEAWRLRGVLAAREVDVVLGPLSPQGGFRLDDDDPTAVLLDAPARLSEAGVRFCLSAAGGTGSSGLWAQALLATRYGMPAPEALRAITRTPAEILGLNERIGRLAVGADADVVVWSGPPLAATSRPVLVVIDGAVVHDARTGSR